MNASKRKCPRMNVEGIGFVTLEMNSTYRLYGTLVNIGHDGMCLDLLPTGAAEPKQGDSITICEAPKALQAVYDKQRGTVAWTDGSFCGLDLVMDDNFTNQEMEDRLREGGLLPWASLNG